MKEVKPAALKTRARKLAESRIKYNDLNLHEWIECKCCGYRAKEIATHVINVHDLTVAQYKEKYHAGVKCQKSCDRVKGANNPGYQHGGKLSCFSKNSTKGFDQTAYDKMRKKNKITANTHPNNQRNRANFESGEAFSKSQARDLNWFQSKFGIEDGSRRHALKTQRWLATLDSKSDKEKARIHKLRGSSPGAISKAEKEIFEHLKSAGIDVESQFSLPKCDTSWFRYDIRAKRRIIEYNGTYWHCDPSKFQSNYFHARIKKTATEIWDKDSDKIQAAEAAGYDVLVVWEREYKKNKTEVLERCKSFLTQ